MVVSPSGSCESSTSRSCAATVPSVVLVDNECVEHACPSRSHAACGALVSNVAPYDVLYGRADRRPEPTVGGCGCTHRTAPGRVPLLQPFHAAHGHAATKVAVLVGLSADEGVGWGECAALAEPTYSEEFVDSAWLVLRDHLTPRLAGWRFDGELADLHSTSVM